MDRSGRVRTCLASTAWLAAMLVAMNLYADGPELTAPARPGRATVTVSSDNLERICHVHVPAGYDTGKPPPLVLVLHGAGGNGRVTLDHHGWSAKSEKNGFVVAAPDGLPSQPRQPSNFRTNPNLWNSGQLNARSPRAEIDDVAYVRKLLDELKSRVSYDARRVYVAGHSNGGGMAFRLAVELSDRFAAIGAVAGLGSVEVPRPVRSLPTLCILGTKDPLMPIGGGEVRLPWGTRRNPPVAEPLAAWAQAIGCESTPRTVSSQDGVLKQEYLSRTMGPTLTVLTIEGHGHVWPGSKSFLPETTVGPSTEALNATDRLWEFFSSVPASPGDPQKP